MLEAYLVILIRKRVTSLTFYSERAAAICPIDTNLGAAAPLAFGRNYVGFRPAAR